MRRKQDAMKGMSWTEQSKETEAMRQPLYGRSEVSAEPAEIGGYASEAIEDYVVLQ